jgi:penicillin-binding protein 2
VTESKIRNRMRVLATLFVLIFAAITTRLWFLQVLASDQFDALADENQIRLVPIEPLRGQILDREGRVLVGNRPSTVVTVDRLGMKGREEQVLYELANVLKVSVDDLRERLDSVRYAPYQPVPVAKDVPEEVIYYLLEHQQNFPGVGYELSSVRSYPNGDLAAHLLGYVGEISEAQLDSDAFPGYRAGETVGKAGVESTYDRHLYGTRGTRAIQVNAQGEVLDYDFRISEAAPGSDVVLSLDLDVQKLAERTLRQGIELARRTFDESSGKYLQPTGGAVVVMDPSNGQVLALASNPTYDPSIFTGGLTNAELAPLENPANNVPQLNRAIQGQYPAGSTFKPFVAAAALRRKIAATDGHYDCPSTYMVPGDTSETIFHNWEGVDRGFIPLSESLVISCDTVFYKYGYEYYLRYVHSGKSREFMQDDLRQMGFGRPTGIDVPGEVAGLIPTADYKWELLEGSPELFAKDAVKFWLPGDSVNMSIGQGFSLITPIQLAVGYSALANGGILYEPHVGLRVERPDGSLVTRIDADRYGKFPIPKRQVDYIRQALTGVTDRGTADLAFAGFPLDRIPVAGKTGTAEVPPKQDYSWFAAMAPADDPKYVVVALIEQGGHGSTTAAPVVRRVLEGLFGIRTGGELEVGEVSD